MAHSVNEVSMHDESGSLGAIIEIKIKTMDSQTYTLQVDKQMPVPALKERIASVTGVVTEHQRLICRGKVLKDDQLLSAYHVEDGHTLHMVVREPTASSSGSLSADSAVDQSSSGNRGEYYQVAPGIVVETFNMPGQGDRVLPDLNRIISAVLGSMGITNPGNGNEGTGIRDHVGDRPGETSILDGTANTTHTRPEQSGTRSSNDRSRLYNTFGVPTGLSFGSLQATVIPDALATLSQYLSHMRQQFTDSGRVSETDSGVSRPENEGGSSHLAQSENVQEGLPSPASLAGLLSATRQLLNEQVEECLRQLGRQLDNQQNVTDPAARVTAQADALRNGVLLQNLGAYFLELGRTVTTLRLGRSPSEAVVNAGPAVFVSSSGPNPLMVQPLPFQPGASFGTPISGTLQPGSGLANGIGTGFVPRRIDIQIRRGASTHQTEPAGSRQSSAQRNSTTNSSGEALINQSSTGTSGLPSSNSGPAVRILPFRTMMAAVPDLNRSPQDSSGGSLGLVYPVLGRYSSIPSANLSSRTGNQVSDEHQSTGVQTQPHSSPESASLPQNSEGAAGNAGIGRGPASGLGQRESVSSRTIDINILSAGGIQGDENSEGQIPPGIFQFLRGLFPGSEFQVESVSSQGTGTGTGSVTEQERTSSAVAQEAEPPMATEEGIFLSRMLEQIMPLISENSGTTAQGVAYSGGHHGDGSASSTPAEDYEVGTSRREADANPGPNPKRRKTE
ncbi:ubiquitin-like domain-containing protein CIP73 isoform X3 [Spinacia oleracea]|uniref:Ubiquitin-like domain-containing protein CIP73 isoform X3 n=1 Tax=Spinacia oleracea TaxID=3562 RepID=A0A9R0J2R9_SPIOL|nr:ubiquitin-like domain-containing protein CIP73 isoform X3 [Spinacia oleracea]